MAAPNPRLQDPRRIPEGACTTYQDSRQQEQQQDRKVQWRSQRQREDHEVTKAGRYSDSERLSDLP